MKKLVLLSLLLVRSFSCGQEPTNIGANGNPITTIQVTVGSSSISVGQSTTLAALAIDSTGATNINITDQCVWSSSNPSILSVSGSIATGVAVGSASVNCAEGGLTGTSSVTILVNSVTITNPSNCGNPCVLPNGIQNVAYTPFTFTATSSVPGAITWDCNGSCAGIFPSGITLGTNGVLSGTTATVGTTNWTVRATNALGGTATLAVRLIIVAASTCTGNFGGPPTYPCASVSTNNPGLIVPIVLSTSPSGTVTTSNSAISPCSPTGTQGCMQWVSGDQFVTTWNSGNGAGNGGNILINGVKFGVATWNSATVATLMSQPGTQTAVSYRNFTACKGISANGTGSGCQNSTAYDTTIPGYVVGSGCITRITDPGSTTLSGQSIGNLGVSGAGTTEYISKNGTYLAVTTSGGFTYIYHLTTSSGCLQVVNTGLPAIKVTGNVAFSKVTDNIFYNAGGAGTYKTEIDKCTINSDTSATCVNFFDYFVGGGSVAGPPCPGVTPFSAPWGPGLFNINATDDEFMASFGSGAQGTAFWVFDYSITAKGLGGLPSCAAVNYATGQDWPFCVSSCSPTTAPTGLFPSNQATTISAVTSTGSQTVAFATSIPLTNANGSSTIIAGDSLVIDTGVNQETVVVTQIQAAFAHVTGFTAVFTKTHSTGTAANYTYAGCWGAPGSGASNIHDVNPSSGGTYLVVTIQASSIGWTQGACSGAKNANQYIFQQFGAFSRYTSNLWENDSSTTGYMLGSHGSNGISTYIAAWWNGPNYRSLSNVFSTTQFAPNPVPFNDVHTSGWPHYCSGTGTTPNDLCPWTNASDSALLAATSAGTGNCPAGTSAVYCPTYLNNVIFAYFPYATFPPGQTSVFFHTYSCNPAGSTLAHCADGIADPFGAGNSISVQSPKGDFVCWASTMLHNLGLDSAGAPVVSVFCGRL